MQQTKSLNFRALSVPATYVEDLAKLGITEPTPIQAEAIPVAMAGKDLIGIAQTGTGKTLAFGLPMACRLDHQSQGLILAPTRELAQQIEETLKKLRVKCVLLVGGASMRNQLNELKTRPTVLVATPGRLLDHMEQGTVRLNRMSCVVLDEADRMLDMGFAPAIKRIMMAVPARRQTMLFSATMPDTIVSLAETFLTNPARIEVARVGEASELVDQELVYLENGAKGEYLDNLLYKNQGTVLVFTRTRHGAKKLAKSLYKAGQKVAEIHSDRSLAQRREALEGFKRGRYRILVATDIAARGIDVKEISLVVNFDLPDQAEDYIHRIGRTGRAGHRGRAISLAHGDQGKLVFEIEKVMGQEIDVSEDSTVIPVKPRHIPGRQKSRARGKKVEKVLNESGPRMAEHHAEPRPVIKAESTAKTSHQKFHGPKGHNPKPAARKARPRLGAGDPNAPRPESYFAKKRAAAFASRGNKGRK